MAAEWQPAERALHQLMKRCVECPPEQPSCPECSSDETCSLIQQSCTACASTACVKINTLPGQMSATSNSTPIGPIVGGVAGGVCAIILLIFLVWRFYLRGSRRKDTWVPPEKTTIGRSGTILTRTNSIASTVLTRASNVIQIAYIPGVTVRSNAESPEIPPPMPSVPSSYAGTSNATSPDIEQHFFMPSRDSTWSDATSMHSNNRISLTPSLANRASVATTIYHNDVVVPPIPAQYAYQTQANMVSVRSGTSTPTSGHTPQIPQMPKLQQIQTIGSGQVVARNVVARPVEIKKAGAPTNAVPTMVNLAKRNSQQIRVREPRVVAISDEKEVVMTPSTVFDESPIHARAPLNAGFASDSLSMSSSSSTHRSPSADISAMIQNAILSATSSSAQLSKHDSGPFSDANEIRGHSPHSPGMF